MFWRHRVPGVAVAAVLAAVALTSCTNDCGPAALRIDRESVEAGGTLTVSAGAASCDLGYPASKTYSLQIIDEHGIVGQPIITAVKPNGSFSQPFTVPADTPAGKTTLHVAGSPMDDCRDGGSCPEYSIEINVTR
jgi:hypothetical protein